MKYTIRYTLTERQLEKAISIFQICIKEEIDGFVINDFGMLQEIRRLWHGELIFGRMFDRRLRDPWAQTLWSNGQLDELSCWSTIEYAEMLNREQATAVELECFGSCADIPSSCAVWIHMPDILLTHGRLCEFGGIGQEQSQRFLPDHCRMQCALVSGIGSAAFLDGKLYQKGNGLYAIAKRSSYEKMKTKHSPITVVYRPGFIESEKK